jgi:hypothetical protein
MKPYEKPAAVSLWFPGVSPVRPRQARSRRANPASCFQPAHTAVLIFGLVCVATAVAVLDITLDPGNAGRTPEGLTTPSNHPIGEVTSGSLRNY